MRLWHQCSPCAMWLLQLSTGRWRSEHIFNTIAAMALAFAEARGYIPNGAVFALAMLGVFLAAPLAATILFRLDQNRQFDQLRLTGVGDRIVLIAVAYGLVAPKLANCGVLLAAGTLSGVVDVRQLILAVLACGLSIAITAVAVSSGMSIRLFVVAGLLGSVLMIGAIAWLVSAGFDWPAWYPGGISPRVWPALLAAECAVALLCVPILSRALRRSVVGAQPSWWLRRLGTAVPLWLPPHIARGTVQSQVAAVVSFAISAAAIAIVWMGSSDSTNLTRAATTASGFASFPLLIAVMTGLTQSQQDAQSGRLDVIRLAPVPSAVGAILSILGHCLPFVLASTLAGLGVLILFGDVPRLTIVALFVATAAPAAFAEGWGWRAKKHLIAGVTALPFCVVVLRQEVAVDPIMTWLLLGWTPLVVAIATFKNPDRPILSGWVAAVAVSGAAYVLLNQTFAMPVGLQLHGLALAAGLMVAASLVDLESRRIGRRLVLLAIVSVGLILIIARSFPWLPGLAVILTAALGWWAGCRIDRRWPPATSVMIRAAIASATFAGGSLLSDVLPGHDRLTPPAFVAAYYVTAAVWVVGVTVLSDVAAVVLHRQSVRKVTP